MTEEYNRLFVFDIDYVIGVIPDAMYNYDIELEQFGLFDVLEHYMCFVIRPHILKFITSLVSNNYQVAIWSAGEPLYVNRVVIGLNKFVKKPIEWKFVWNADQCEPITYIKDLSRIQKYFPEYNDPHLITFFDDLPQHIDYNKENGFNCVLVPRFKLTMTDDFFFEYKIEK